jgi:RHS repeat-associated protein
MTVRAICGKTGNRSRHHFTGKERDTESGNDYFGARYYSSSMGQFMTPDPLLSSGRPSNPQMWNRYSYALNNPLKIVDPTGLYNLVNTCLPGDKKCNKKFKQDSEDLKNQLEALNAALDDPNVIASIGQDAAIRLMEGLAAMGSENDGNNVDVQFGTNQDGAAAQTVPKPYDEDTKSFSGFTVTFDPQKNHGSSLDYAINGDHEGQHIWDYKNYMLDPQRTEEAFQVEYRGYQNSSWAAQALGLPGISFKGIEVWNRSWSAADRETLRDKNITKVVTDKDHPESQRHNPNTP